MMEKTNVLMSYIKKYKWKYLIGTLVLLVVDILNLYIPQFTGEITDGLQSHAMGVKGVAWGVGKIIIVGLILAIGRFFWRYCIFGAARSIECELRNDMFGHLEKLSMRYFNENKTGELMSFANSSLPIACAISQSRPCAVPLHSFPKTMVRFRSLAAIMKLCLIS